MIETHNAVSFLMYATIEYILGDFIRFKKNFFNNKLIINF